MDKVAPSISARQTWHRLRRAFRLGLKSLRVHGLRSFLTALGIVFGVCSVIAMLAIGEGASFEAQEQIKNLGSENILVHSVKPPEDRKVSDAGSQSFVLQYGLTRIDLRRIEESIPGVLLTLPARVTKDYVWNISHRVDCDIVGTLARYPIVRNHRVAQGRFFTEREMDAKANVCVLSSEVVSSLFPLDSPLGRQVRIGSAYYQVVGVMEDRGSVAALEGPQDSNRGSLNRIFIPLETARERFGEVYMRERSGSMESERVELHEITVRARSTEQVRPVAEAIRGALAHGHKRKDYEMIVPLELLRRAERTKQIFSIVLGSIAAISLLVGGIGIMNIMLATVTERTREIGIRRALGARQRDIVTQFLVETVLLSGAGGIMGVMAGLAVPWMVTHFSGMRTIVVPWAPVLAFSISALVGIVFGIYPALRAARMDPVEALRHE
ncbi:MAG: ABC transporter permease [Verrucomicrobia bacterium]|nr:ABC transporter permease [Verrucomicrobiota bacterium]MBI3868094.1 ABC transporter permease [Verrucomicrobiota bacterium]